MGGCASKPKEFDAKPEAPAPTEEPVKASGEGTVDQAEATPAAATEESSKEAEQSKKEEEAPLVDLSNPKEEEAEKETKPVEAAASPAVLQVPEEAEIVFENPKGKTVEVEVAAKEGEVIYVEAIKEATKEEVEEKKKEASQEKPKEASTASEENKKEELLVKV